MKTKKLPESWKEIELGEVLDYEQPGKYIVNGVNYDNKYKIPVLTAGKSFILGYTNEKEGIYNKLPVIIFDDFTTENKFVDFSFKVKSSAMKLLTPKRKNVNLKFIFLLMQTIKLDSTTHKRYYLSKYRKLKIPLPSLPVQKKIVQILEKVEELKQKREQADKLMDDYLKSVFSEMFGNPFKNKNNFEVKKVKEIVNLINGRAFKPSDWSQNGLKIIRIQNLNNPNAKFNYYKGKVKSQYIVEKWDLLLSWSGTPKTSFGVFIWEGEKSVLNQHIFNVKLKEKNLNKTYFQYFINSKLLELISKAHGGVGLQHITKRELDNVNFFLPPLPLQKKFALIVKKVEKLKEKQKQSSKEINNLFNALMQKAFKGELIK